MTKRFLVISLLLLLAPSVKGQQRSEPLDLLVLGDSLSWGAGLKTKHKTWYHLKTWLEKTTGRTVRERIEAHSGAVIDGIRSTDTRTATNPEVNLSFPTVHEQIDHALQAFPDPSLVDLVLVSACGNDVGTRNLLNASKSEAVGEMTSSKCGAPMEKLLRRIATTFPAAHIVVTGYYPFFSERTQNSFVMRTLARTFFAAQTDKPGLSSKEIFERLNLNSRLWYESSNKTLEIAAQRINSETGGRVSFAKIEFRPEYSFAAPRTYLWGIDQSPLRMALALFSFGKIKLPSNDEVRRQRAEGCNEVFRKEPNETIEKKRERKAQHLFCRYAALGHPNKRGAILYADAITKILSNPEILSKLSKGLN